MATILILEDDKSFAALLEMSLQAEGHECILCHDASSAFDAYFQHKVDLILTDIIVKKDGVSVPDGGISLISRIRHHTQSTRKTPPIVAMSGILGQPGLEHALSLAESLGADAVLAKPFEPDQLTNLINTLLSEWGVADNAV